MSLQIDLVDSRPFYHPGDHIEGRVILDSKKSEDITQVFVDFTGRCKVKIRRHDHYTTISHRTRGYYFRLREIVYDGGSYTFQSGSRSWPFSFTVPLEADGEDPRSQRPAAKRELDKIGILRRNDLEGLESDHFTSSPTWRGSYDSFRGRADPHRLPDTFEYVSNRFPASCEARVEYELTATLKRPTRGILFPSKDLEASHDIFLKSRNFLEDFRPKSRPAPPEVSQIVNIKHDFAASQLASNNGTKTSLLNKAAMNIFKSNDLPEVSVNICVFLDRHCRSGGNRLFALQASQEARLIDPTPLPPIKLRSYILRLIARTALRARQESVMVQDVNHYAADGRVLLLGKGLDLDVPYGKGDGGNDGSPLNAGSLDEWLNISSTGMANASDGQFVTPTFKTYNITREYEFALEMKLECAGIKYDIKKENIAVTILADEDFLQDGNKNGTLRGVPTLAEQDHAQAIDTKHAREQLDQSSGTNEKQGHVPPTPREEEPELLPQYEPGDVPDYHTGVEPSRLA